MAATLKASRELARWQWEIARRASRMRWPLVAMSLLLAGAVLVGADAWQQQTLRHYEDQHPVIRPAQYRAPKSPDQQARLDLDAFYHDLPAANALTAPTMTLLRLGEKAGLHMGQGEYHAIPDADSALVRYEVVLPVEGSPLVIESYLSDAMKALRPLTVRAVSFERDDVLADHVKARIHFVIFARST